MNLVNLLNDIRDIRGVGKVRAEYNYPNTDIFIHVNSFIYYLRRKWFEENLRRVLENYDQSQIVITVE